MCTAPKIRTVAVPDLRSLHMTSATNPHDEWNEHGNNNNSVVYLEGHLSQFKTHIRTTGTWPHSKFVVLGLIARFSPSLPHSKETTYRYTRQILAVENRHNGVALHNNISSYDVSMK